MFAATLNREQFVSWLAGSHVPQSRRITAAFERSVTAQEICVVSKLRSPAVGDELAVVVPQGAQRDFYAFVSTYIGAFSPFSAFIRVLPLELLTEVLELAPSRLLPEQVAGVSIVEACFQSRGRFKAASEISLTAASATLSATLAAAVMRGWSGIHLDPIADAWSAARRLSNDEPLRLAPSKIVAAWRALISVTQGYASSIGPQVDLALSALLREGETRADHLRAFSSGLPSLERGGLGLSSAREARVEFLSQILAEAKISRIEEDARDFVIGYLASAIGNGSLDYLPLLDVFGNDYPGAAIWFGICSVLWDKSDALQVGDCLGRRLARDSFAAYDCLSPPKFDVSVEELEVIGVGKGRVPFRTAQPGVAIVEFYPGVSGRVGVGPRPEPERAQSRTYDRDEVRELKTLLDRARHVAERLGADQPDFFSDGRRRNRR